MNTRVKDPNAISKNAVSVRVLIARFSMDHRQRAPAAPAPASADAARVESSKVRSLLEINKTLAKENTFLSQQFDVLSKEAASLSHLLRSRHVLNAARELELKSALETSKHALREKEETVRRLEGRIDELEAHLKFAEELVVRAATDGEKTRREEMAVAVEMEKKKDKDEGKEMGNGENTPGTGATAKSAKSAKSARTTDVAYLEANHPWLSPVLLRLERLSNDSENEFRVPSSKRFSPSNEDRALAAADVDCVDLTLSGGEDSIDAGSGAYGIFDGKGGDMHGSDDSDEGGERGDRFETPEPVRCRLSVVDQPGSSVLKTPITGPRSSLRRRNTVNYALPSLNAKLRQGDAHTFGSVERPAANPRNRKR